MVHYAIWQLTMLSSFIKWGKTKEWYSLLLLALLVVGETLIKWYIVWQQLRGLFLFRIEL